MKIKWLPSAIKGLSRYFRDQEGVREIAAAVAALVDDQKPSNAFVRGEYRRLHVGPYRIVYALDAPEWIVIVGVDRVEG